MVREPVSMDEAACTRRAAGVLHGRLAGAEGLIWHSRHPVRQRAVSPKVRAKSSCERRRAAGSAMRS